MTNDTKGKYYTGIENLFALNILFGYVESSLDLPLCDLSKDELFVMALTRLRLNTPLSSLAYDYNVCLTTVSKYFHRSVYIIYECCKWAIEPTDRTIAIRHMPVEFSNCFGFKRVFIIDCFEVHCQTPSNLKAAASHYSNYKKHETVKFLIAAHPDGTIAFVSLGFAGRCSDREICIKSGFLDLVEENDVVLADKGFEIHDLIERKKAVLNIPTFLRQKVQFSTEEIRRDKQITALRIHIERIIGLIREKYTILSNTVLVNTLARFQNGHSIIDLIVKVCCILVNFNKTIMK